MVLKIYKWFSRKFLPLLCTFLVQPALAQDFNECQRLVKDLLPVFNQSFEENNPSLLRNDDYQKKLHALQSAYLKYHNDHFLPSDSVRRMNNEAVILALSGSYHKALHIMEGLDLSQQQEPLMYNRGLMNLLGGKYQQARTQWEGTSRANTNLNILYSFGKEKKYTEAEAFARSNSARNTGGKWNYNLGLVHKFNGQLDEAENELSAAVKQKDEIVAYRLQRGDILMKLGNQKKAVKDFEKVARKHPKAQIRYANALLSLSQFASAKAVFETYLESEDRTFRGDAYLGLAHSYYGLMQFGEAQRYYKLSATLKRENSSLLCGFGNVHLSKHEYQFAFNMFDKVLKKDTSFLPAYLGRAVAYFGMKKYDLALQDFKTAEKAMDGDNKFYADLFVTKAYSEYYLGKTKEAAADFEKAIHLDPARYEALAGMSNILIEEKRFAEAGQYLANALKYEQNYDLMWSNYGNLLLHFDMFQKGFQVFRKAVALNPQNINAQNGWGIVLLENDQLDRSIALFDSLLKEQPQLSFLHNNHGIVQAYIGNRHEQAHQVNEANARYDGAYEDFRKAMDTAPSRKLYNVNQGNVYRYWEKYDEAKLSYQSYQDKSALNNTAVMYAGIDRMKDAKYYLGVAIKIDSLHRVFQYNLNILVKGKQKEMMRLVASSGDDGPFSDISLKYSRDGFVTIYLYDYVYDKLSFPGRHFMPLPVAEYREDYFIPEYDFKLVPYEKDKNDSKKHKTGKYRSQKVKMPGGKNKSGTKCPVFR